jgi:predicted metal-binding protein
VKQQPLHTIATDWTDFVLICRKCSRKLDGGFGVDGDVSLRRALRQAMRRRGRRGALSVVEAGCFGVCPKAAVSVARGKDASHLVVVPRHFSADALLDHLLGAEAPSAPNTIMTGDANP